MRSNLGKLRQASIAVAAIIGLAASPLGAQVETIDPDTQIDADLAGPPPAEQPGDAPVYGDPQVDAVVEEVPAEADGTTQADVPAATSPAPAETSASGTYREDDLIGAAEGVFGKGAEGVAKLIQKLLKDQGEPNAYIVGREAGGAFAVGLRYGSGTLHHKVEGEMPVYWTGPSIGFDVGANAGSTFVLVYNLYDSEDLYKRFPAGEGQAYAVGGLTASYLRKGDVVMIPIRVGAGLRLGANVGYMKFSKEQKWLPF